MPGRVGRSLTAVATYSAIIVVTLLLAEGVIRIWDDVPLLSTENFVASAIDSIHKAGAPSVYDPVVGWTSKPNSSWDASGKEVETGGTYTFGEYGVRMPSTDRGPLQQGAILTVGDSFAAGSEVGDADSFPAQLEKMTGIQVINAGTGGYGLDQIVLRAETLVPLLRPRILIVQTRVEFGLSVSRMSLYGGTPKPYFTVQSGELAVKNEPVPRRASSRRDIGWLRSTFGHSYLVQYAMTRFNKLQWWASPAMSTKLAISDADALNVSCLLMQRIRQLADQYHTKVIVLFQYSGVDGLSPKLAWEKDRDRVIACVEQQHLELIDALDSLRSIYKKGGPAAYTPLWVMHDNGHLYGHMSKKGNQMIADLIFPRVFNQAHLGNIR